MQRADDTHQRSHGRRFDEDVASVECRALHVADALLFQVQYTDLARVHHVINGFLAAQAQAQSQPRHMWLL